MGNVLPSGTTMYGYLQKAWFRILTCNSEFSFSVSHSVFTMAGRKLGNRRWFTVLPVVHVLFAEYTKKHVHLHDEECACVLIFYFVIITGSHEVANIVPINFTPDHPILYYYSTVSKPGMCCWYSMHASSIVLYIDSCNRQNMHSYEI